MIDDDLDRLLADVDGEPDYSASREESLRVKQKIARKSDSTVEETVDGLSTDEVFSRKLSDSSVDQDILVFRNGIVSAIRKHQELTQKFRRQLVEADISDNVRQAVQKYKYTFLRFIENIDKDHDEYAINLNEEVISKKAKKDFNIFFQGFEEDNKLNFMVLKEYFLRLREFNSLLKKEWSELANSISVINLVADGKVLFQELNGIIADGQKFTRTTEKFLERLALVMGIPDGDYDVLERDIYNKIRYHDLIDYSYESLFDPKAMVKNDGGGDAADGPSVNKGIGPIAPERNVEPAVRPAEKPSETVGRAESPAPVKFTLRGTAPWNTREPYLLKVDGDRLSKDLEDFATAFYFVILEEKGIAHEGAVKRAMIRYLSDTTLVIKDNYEEFIFKTIVLLARDMSAFFDFTGELKNLFFYHLGPATMHRQIISVFQDEKYGMCYKYMQGNRVVRFIPGEYIKLKIIGWHEENINSLKLDFDKVQFFDEVRRKVSAKYREELEKYSKQLDDLISKLKLDQNKNFSRDEYFKSKWNEWFGVSRILVYNRFVERTIFK